MNLDLIVGVHHGRQLNLIREAYVLDDVSKKEKIFGLGSVLTTVSVYVCTKVAGSLSFIMSVRIMLGNPNVSRARVQACRMPYTI